MTPRTSTEQITNAVCARLRVVSDLSIDQLEAEIESLGYQAAQIELWDADKDTPYWLRQVDARRIAELRATQADLLAELTAKKLRARDNVMENLPRVNVWLAKPGMSTSWRDVLLKIGCLIALGGAGWGVIYALGDVLLRALDKVAIGGLLMALQVSSRRP